MSEGTLLIINLSHNMLEGFDQLPNVLPWIPILLGEIDLSHNRLQGPVPVPSPNIKNYLVSSNLLTGEIPSSFWGMSSVYTLDLSHNKLYGTIPPCLGNLSPLTILRILKLKDNKFSGNILQTYGEGNNLKMLDLSQNQLEGRMPISLGNCTNLEVLDFAENQIKDTFPF